MSQALIDAAKAPFLAYNDKNWEAVARSMTAEAVYDEVGTHRALRGTDDIISVWKDWAEVFPDSKATFHEVYVAGTTVVIELSWRGTHRGTMQTPAGPIPATGRSMDLPACQIVQVVDGKAARIKQYFDLATLMNQIGAAPAGV